MASTWTDSMTVGELVSVLLSLRDQNMVVITEGCDCDGPAADCMISGEEVVITRARQPDGFRGTAAHAFQGSNRIG